MASKHRVLKVFKEKLEAQDKAKHSIYADVNEFCVGVKDLGRMPCVR